MTPLSPTHYQAFFCEENIWWLNQHPQIVDLERRVLLVTNPSRSVALGGQRAGDAHGVVIWDYHVILAVLENEWMIYDLDATAGLRQTMDEWFQTSIALFEDLPPRFIAQFRAISGDTYHQEFASDRHHMLDEHGHWRQPPPQWPCIGEGHTLDQFIGLDDSTYGPLMDHTQLIKKLNHLD